MLQEPKMSTPIFRFEIASEQDEIELVTEILYDAIINHSQFDGLLYQKYPELTNAIDVSMNVCQIRKIVSSAISVSYQSNKKEIAQKIRVFEQKRNTL